DVIVLAGQLGSEGTVDGTLYGSTLLMSQGGTIGGNLEVQSDRLGVSREAIINGNVRYQSPTDADVNGGATIRGETVRTNATPWTGIEAGALAPFGPLLKIAWSLVLAAALVAV